MGKLNFIIYAKTYLSKGLKFYAKDGAWQFIQQESSEASPLHWIQILYEYRAFSGKYAIDTSQTNAVTFFENNEIIVEITRDVQYGQYIRSSFYNINKENISTLLHYNSLSQTLLPMEKPLDLSKETLNGPSSNRNKSVSKKQILNCDTCGKRFDRPSLLKRHIRTHTGERPHICEICTKGFSTSSSLNTHKRIHSGERPHVCNICGKRFTASSNLYYHRMTHYSEKPHKCNTCGKSFPTPGNLKSHSFSHEGTFPFQCPVCTRTFTKQCNLRNHMNIHSTS